VRVEITSKTGPQPEAASSNRTVRLVQLQILLRQAEPFPATLAHKQKP
jgi:hypothetical protein